MVLYCLYLDFTSVEAYFGRINLLCPDNFKVTLQLAHGIYIWKSDWPTCVDHFCIIL